ncbi:hypothetical protein M758_N004500, partial [Ceratodon purpureus]
LEKRKLAGVPRACWNTQHLLVQPRRATSPTSLHTSGKFSIPLRPDIDKHVCLEVPNYVIQKLKSQHLHIVFFACDTSELNLNIINKNKLKTRYLTNLTCYTPHNSCKSPPNQLKKNTSVCKVCKWG